MDGVVSLPDFILLGERFFDNDSIFTDNALFTVSFCESTTTSTTELRFKRLYSSELVIVVSSFSATLNFISILFLL